MTDSKHHSQHHSTPESADGHQRKHISFQDSATAPVLFLQRSDLQRFIETLISRGFQVVGPVVDQEAIVYGEIHRATDLPHGWTDLQEAGKYRLMRRDDEACFGFVVGPHSWKKYLFPPLTLVATADRDQNGWRFSTPQNEPPRYAFLGVRSCELAAIAIQDRVFTGGPFVDPEYQKRRSAAFIIAVNCTQAATTCFCPSTKTGPRCTAGFDLALTEISSGFLFEIGTEAGSQVAEELSLSVATTEQLQLGNQARRQAEEQISRSMKTDDLPDLLLAHLRHPHWDDVAERCLSCANCTMVCPTCFCSTVHDLADLTGDHVDRQRRWDSCFNIDFSQMNGNATRNSISSRYRQWLTHKLATWHDQFGTSGCVGCGRCITWCPVGIDLTQEVSTIRSSVLTALSDPDPASAVVADADNNEHENSQHSENDLQ